MKEKELSYYIKESKKIEFNNQINLKISLLSNFTIKGLKEILMVKCHDLQINCSINETGYNQIYQEILDKRSSLKDFNPHLTFFLLSPEFILEEYTIKYIKNKDHRKEFIQKKTSEFIQLINSFLDNISGIIIISNLKQESYSPIGIIEEKTEFSRKYMIINFNQSVKNEFIFNDRVFIYDFNSFFTKYGEYNVINDKLRYLGDFFISTEYLPLLGEELMSFIKPYISKNKKCIILDLDNTLWGGIVGEDGFNNIKLDNKPPGNSFIEFQKYLLALNERGIILAVNSHNNLEEALRVIREHPYMVLKEENFSSIKINWENKVNNIIEIAKELNIGIDSLVFIDDDPLNRSLVKELLPEVLVVDLPKDSSLYVKTLKSINDFNTLQLTKEDFNKKVFYSQQKKRLELKSKINNLDDFLRSLEIEIVIKRADDFTIPRISQLTMKTNQFNLTTKRYSESDIRKYVNSPEYSVFSVSVKDKLGDNGLSGVIILNRKSIKSWIINTFLLSCRVFGRKIENSMLDFIIMTAKKEHVKKIIGKFYSTEKNILVKDFYIDNDFIKINENNFELIILNQKLKSN